ncbi:MAG: hypothetical protein ACT4NT_03045 [Nitrososphaerota archaeon]
MTAHGQIFDYLPKEQQPTWYFGEGLNVGDEFTYNICDSILRIPESPNHCYTITMKFLTLLPSPEGKTWIVSAHVDHKTRTLDMIFHVSANSFKIKTDGTSIPYADSIERTLGWMWSFSNENRPQILSVGKSWGVVTVDMNSATEITVNQIDSLEFGGQMKRTYLLGYTLIEDSYLHIMDDFPFPLKAVIYKPVFSSKDVSPEFTFQLINYQNYDKLNICYAIESPDAPTNELADLIPENHFDDELHPGFGGLRIEPDEAMYAQNPNNTDVEVFTLNDLPKSTNLNSTTLQFLKDAYGDDYKQKLQQSLYNFTKFVEIIARASNIVTENQTGGTNSLP